MNGRNWKRLIFSEFFLFKWHEIQRLFVKCNINWELFRSAVRCVALYILVKFPSNDDIFITPKIACILRKDFSRIFRFQFYLFKWCLSIVLPIRKQYSEKLQNPVICHFISVFMLYSSSFWKLTSASLFVFNRKNRTWWWLITIEYSKYITKLFITPCFFAIWNVYVIL